ncbi:MAG TPA: helix-turn-helix transcriptional regulator [Pyrinomonadaceae bacterium]|nr:helix-turn-helix transcriptional regulator [Pyrinomonadaceae bacterium]
MKKASPTKSGRLAKKLRKIRLDLELSQNQILERLGFADDLFRSNISQYERGHRVPSPPVLLEYARLANVDLALLIDDDLDLPETLSATSKSAVAKRPAGSRKKKR